MFFYYKQLHSDLMSKTTGFSKTYKSFAGENTIEPFLPPPSKPDGTPGTFSNIQILYTIP